MNELKKQNKQNSTTLKGKFETLKKLYNANEKKSFEACVELAVHIFQDVFNHQILQLLNAFPADHIIEESGKPFWSGLKRAPTALTLNLNDPIHVELIQAAANIFATIFKIPMELNKVAFVKYAQNVKPVEFVPKKVKIETDEKKKEETVVINEDDEKDAENLYNELLGYKIDHSKKPQVVEFEKDDPTNFHIEFMGGVSNLRARNYKI